MKQSRPPKRPSTAALLAVLLAIGVTPMAAAQVYRIVGPDGKVTYTDKPPEVRAKPAPAGASTAAASGARLPYALQQPVARYPVTLYTGDGCAPCDRARSYLRGRGVPFTEKTVNTDEDIKALQQGKEGAVSLPVGTVGTQRLTGFSEGSWKPFLDAAGYPATSALPRNYSYAPATPLAPPKEQKSADAAEPAADGEPKSADPATVPVEQPATEENPTGLRF